MLEDFDDSLRERLIEGRGTLPNPKGEFILYWVQFAMRAEENPALDASLLLGERLKRPVLCLQVLPEGTPHANDRHHRFVLEGALDLSRALKRRRIAYALCLERKGHGGDVLLAAAQRAAFVLTEHMPTPPWRERVQEIAAKIEAPLWAVDTACVVPMSCSKRRPDRAFSFRENLSQERAQRVGRPWIEHEDPSELWHIRDLPFEPIDLEKADFDALIASADIDHSVPPVPDTCGGSEAGYARFSAFLKTSLARYERDRNDAAKQGGVSRMSAYLHYGMVSPFRLAREATRLRAEKWLDELLVWRELAYHYCHHTPDLHGEAAIPAWARATLDAHASDQRPAIFDREQLARAATGDPLWDAAQRSLLIHGELHNNLRMTWGKAILSWTRNRREAQEILIALNHRYALDGQDPASYGGLYWCLGLFDRPFEPEQEILGTVRSRPLVAHAERLDLAAYERHVRGPAAAFDPKAAGPIAIVGAGVAGLAAARLLHEQGYAVRVFERSKRPGGRLASTRIADAVLDHGALSMAASTDAFRAFLTMAESEQWLHRIEVPEAEQLSQWIAVPSQNAFAAAMAEGLDLVANSEIGAIAGASGGQLQLMTAEGAMICGPSAVILAIPAPQVARIAALIAPDLARGAQAAEMAPQFAVVLRGDVADPALKALSSGGPIARAERHRARAGRTGDPAIWILQTTADFAKERLLPQERAALAEGLPVPKTAATAARDEALGEELRQHFCARTQAPTAEVLLVHRWGLAVVQRPADLGGARCLFQAEPPVLAAGDWCVTGAAGGVEAAWLSGIAAAGRLMAHFARTLGPRRGQRERQGELF